MAWTTASALENGIREGENPVAVVRVMWDCLSKSQVVWECSLKRVVGII
jgi:hypothetical protein